MGKVLVRKSQDVRKNQDATNLVSSLIGSGPKTNLGAALGGFGGGLSFLTRLATAGEQQQDAVSGLGSASLAGYGGYRGGASLGDGLMDAGAAMKDRYEQLNPMSDRNIQARRQRRANLRYPHLKRDEDGNIDRKDGNIDLESDEYARAQQMAGEGRDGTKGEWDKWASEDFKFPSPYSRDTRGFQVGVIGKPTIAGRQAVRGFAGSAQPNLFDATETDFTLSEEMKQRIRDSAPALPSSIPMHSIQAGNAAAVPHPLEHTPKAGVPIMPPPPDPVTKPVQGTGQGETDMPSMADNSMGGNEDGGMSAVTELDAGAVSSLSDDPNKERYESLIQGFEEKMRNKGEPMDIAFLLLKAVVL